MTSTPKTNCQACHLDSEDGIINGYKAFDIFEEDCISYLRPDDSSVDLLPDFSNVKIEENSFLEPLYANIDDINVSYDENGKKILEIAEEDIMFFEETGL